MPLVPRKVEIPLFGGLRQDISTDILEPPHMVVQQNIRFDKEGRARKRWGYTELNPSVAPIPGGGSIASPRRLASRDQSELLVFSPTLLYSRAQDRWTKMGRVPGIVGLERTVVANEYAGGDVINTTCAYSSSGYVAFVWEIIPAGGAHVIQAAVIDIEHKQIVSSVAFGDAYAPRIVATADNIILVFADGLGTNLRASRFDLQILGSWSGLTNIVTNHEAATSENFDVAADTGAEAFYVANTNLVASGRDLDVRRFNATSLALTHSGLDVRGGGKECLKPSLVHNGSTLFVSFFNDTDDTIEILGRTTPDVSVSAFGVAVVSTGTVVPNHVTSSAHATGVWVAWDTNGTFAGAVPTAVQKFEWRSVSTGGAVGANGPWKAQNLRLASRPFLANDLRTYVATSTRETQADQYGLVLVDIGDTLNPWNINADNPESYRGRPVGKWMTGDYHTAVTEVLTDSPQGQAVINEVGVEVANEVYQCYVKRDIVGGASPRGGAVELTILKHDNLEAWNGTCQAGRDLFIPAAMPYCYDGEAPFECDYAWWPWIETGELQAGGSLADNTTYNYVVVYEWVDRTGRIWRSHPSTTQSPTVVSGAGVVTAGANRFLTGAGVNKTVQLRIPHISMTSRIQAGRLGHSIAIVVYRQNETTGETTWFRLARPNKTFDTSDPTAAIYLVFTDNGATYNTTGQPELYTTNTISPQDPNFPPRPSSYSCIFDSRVFQVGTDDPRTIWYSKELVEGEAPGFHEGRFITTPDDGPVVALAALGPYLIIFKNRSIYWMQGQGPDDVGANNGYTPPAKVYTDRGCISPSSVTVSPLGVFFQSERGIDLLTTALAIENRGAAVEDIIESNLLISSGAVHLQDSEVRFTIVSTGGGEDPEDGGILKYNYEFDRWSRDVVFSGNVAPATGVYHDGLYYWADFTELVVQEERSGALNTFCDQEFLGTTHEVPYLIITPPIKMDGLQGFQRLWRITLFGHRLHEDMVDSPGVNVSVNFDGSGNAGQFSWPSTEIVDQSNPPFVQLRIAPAVQRCSSISLAILESLPPGTSTDQHNAGIAWTSAMLEYGIEPKPLGRFKGSANK